MQTGATPEKINRVVDWLMKQFGPALTLTTATRLAIDVCSVVHPPGFLLSHPEREAAIEELLADYVGIRTAWANATTPDTRAFLYYEIAKYLHSGDPFTMSVFDA